MEDPSRGRSVSGTIETDEVRVASRYGGRVVKISAAEGDSLQAAQPIVELDAAELKAKRDRLAAQVAEYEAGPRPQEIDAAKHDWEALVAESGPGARGRQAGRGAVCPKDHLGHGA